MTVVVVKKGSKKGLILQVAEQPIFKDAEGEYYPEKKNPKRIWHSADIMPYPLLPGME